MVAAKEETGNRYGRLLVLSRSENNRHGGAVWLCQCDCGNETVASGCNLRGGTVKSCGCLVGSDRLPEGKAAFNKLFVQIRHSAERRGYVWELTRERVRTLTEQPCYYCGIEPNQMMRCFSSEYIYNGIDRKDNNVGYTEANCVSCCTECNWVKGTRTAERFIEHAAEVVRTANRMRGLVA